MKRVLFLSAAVALVCGFVAACNNHHCDENDNSMALVGYSLPLKGHSHHHHSTGSGGGGGGGDDCH